MGKATESAEVDDNYQGSSSQCSEHYKVENEAWTWNRREYEISTVGVELGANFETMGSRNWSRCPSAEMRGHGPFDSL